MAKDKDKDRGRKVAATNRKAFHDYAIEEKLEAGVVFVGNEVALIRGMGKIAWWVNTTSI
jgi:SsrA-binding protein